MVLTLSQPDHEFCFGKIGLNWFSTSTSTRTTGDYKQLPAPQAPVWAHTTLSPVQSHGLTLPHLKNAAGFGSPWLQFSEFSGCPSALTMLSQAISPPPVGSHGCFLSNSLPSMYLLRYSPHCLSLVLQSVPLPNPRFFSLKCICFSC